MSFSKNKIVTNLFWRYLERTFAQLLGVIVYIILARILSPDDFGTVALINVFISIMQVFATGGFGAALVQKKDATDVDFSTVFWGQMFLCLVLYCFLFVMAPFVANFYGRFDLLKMFRVASLSIIVFGFRNIQLSYISKHLLFKKFFYSTSIGTVVAACLSIFLAYYGFGAWALIIYYVCNMTIDCMVLWIVVKWKPKFVFSISSLQDLFSYGWKILVATLINSVYSNLYQLVIGKKYSSSDLAFYNKGELFPKTIVSNINSSLDSVLFPAMSMEQYDPMKLKALTRRSITMSVYFIAPLMMGLAACAPCAIRLILTEKWSSSVPFLRIFCITFMFYPIHTANLNAIKALGRSDIFLRIEIVKKSLGLVILFISMRFGVMCMAYSLLVTSIIGQIVNTSPNKKLLNYSYLEQLKDIMPELILAVFMGCVVSLINFIPIYDWLKLFLQIIIGICIYVGSSIIFKIEAFYYIKNILLMKHKVKRN